MNECGGSLNKCGWKLMSVRVIVWMSVGGNE